MNISLKELTNKAKNFLPQPIFRSYHFLLALFGAIIFGFPSKRIRVIGVTGTSGKSSVVNLISLILKEGGRRVASLSSVEFAIHEEKWPNKLKMTMPGRFFIQRFLSRAVKEKCDYAVIEVSSQGIEQSRHKFINFEASVFTNLSPEHIEAHGGFENYKKAKGKLFSSTKNIHILNLDDKHSPYFLGFEAREKYGYRLKNCDPDIKKTNAQIQIKSQNIIEAESIRKSVDGISFFVKNKEFNMKLRGKFNVYNALAAISAGLSQNIDLETCKKALLKARIIPGRMEVVVSSPFRIVIDYAVTPDNLENIYKEINELFLPKNLICVFGACGGGRDKWKRPALGEIASRYCRKILLTNEDPYDEDPAQILSMIKSGIQNPKFHPQNLYEILDRKKAIEKAISLAKEGDVVIITGKGCEPWICLAGGKKIPWDDKKIALDAFRGKKYEKELI